MAPETSSGDAWTWALLEPELSEKERELRDRFVVEYLKDHDTSKAASRCGFQESFAKEYGLKFYHESYVQKKLKELEEKSADNPKDEERRIKLKTIRVLERILGDDNTPSAARVAAARELGNLYSWHEKEKSLQNQSGHQGGVMMVPAIADLDKWEQSASATQEKLVQDARS